MTFSTWLCNLSVCGHGKIDRTNAKPTIEQINYIHFILPYSTGHSTCRTFCKPSTTIIFVPPGNSSKSQKSCTVARKLYKCSNMNVLYVYSRCLYVYFVCECNVWWYQSVTVRRIPFIAFSNELSTRFSPFFDHKRPTIHSQWSLGGVRGFRVALYSCRMVQCAAPRP